MKYPYIELGDYKARNIVSRFMQILLVLLLAWGFYSSSSKVVINSFAALIVSFLPAILERDYKIALSPAIEVWAVGAVFLHALGSIWFYSNITWWDHLTHSLSASVVAALGYATIRIIDLYYEDEVKIPRRYMFLFILITVLAFGVIWELFEFGLDVVSFYTGLDMPLAQHGMEDTMKDMTFNTFGALIVAVLGHAYLSETAQQIWDKLNQ